MTLKDLQQQAWQIAEQKGQHKNLDGVPSLGVREQALLAIAPIYGAVTELTQEIKRHGIGDDKLLFRLLCAIMKIATACSLTIEHLEEPLAIPQNDMTCATIIRLVLTHTELDEAIDVLIRKASLEDTVWRTTLAEEIADAYIRQADLAACLGIDMESVIQEKMAYNTTRPYGYGTPLEETYER